MKIFKSITAVLLIICVVFVSSSCGSSNDEQNTETEQTEYSTPASFVNKTETVYVNLSNTGKVTKTIVSDWIHTTEPNVYVDDVTNLSSIVNVKDDVVPIVDGQNLRWNMNTTDLYYQGRSDAPLPVDFSITYKLDGEDITAHKLLGQSGRVEINLEVKNKDSYNVKVNGSNVTMYNPFVLVGGVALNEAKFQNISVKNGKTIGSGNLQYAVLAGFPGIKDSLGLSTPENGDSSYSFDDTYSITADVTDFELGNLMFAVIPISSLDIGLNGIASSMDDVRANLSKLQSVQKSLQSINANDLISSLSSGDKLNQLTSLISQASTLYESNKALLSLIDKYTTTENMQAIQGVTDYISSADFAGLESALEVIQSFLGSDYDLSQIKSGINVLKKLSDELNQPDVQKAIQNLPNTVATLNALQKAVNENKALFDALQSLPSSSSLQSISSTLSGLEGSIATNSLSSFGVLSGNSDVVAAKMTAWFELGKTYNIFTKKSDSATSKVSFVFKVNSIKTKKMSDEAEDVEVEEADETETKKESGGIIDWFKNLFKKENSGD